MIDRYEKAMLAMQLGAPEGVLTVPNRPIAYFVDDQTLYAHVWSPNGKFVCHTFKTTPFMPGDEYSVAVTVGTVSLWYHFPTYSLLPFNVPAHSFTPEQLAIRKAASRHFNAKHVTLPRELHVADRSETMRRYYARQQANALLEHMPEGFIWVPSAARTAYQVQPNGSIMTVRPVTDARRRVRGEGGALTFKMVRISGRTGLCTIEKRQYRFDPIKNLLILVEQP